MLATVDLCRQFGGLHAVDGVSLRVARGERRAVIGPNGAGKTTLVHLISGHIRPSQGRVWLDDKDVTALSADGRARAGIARSFQVTNLLHEMTVLEMCMMAAYGRTGAFGLVRPLLGRAADRMRVEQLLDEWGLGDRRGVEVNTLSYGEQRMLEIVVALVQAPRALLLDEPTAGLSRFESRQAIDAIRRLPSDLTLLLVEHDMDAVFELADSITVMYEGKELATGAPDAIRSNGRVQEVYTGPLAMLES
jgi:branched-chain amino acid transport system ATP-binding protein